MKKHVLLKNTGLFLLACIGLLYALPNLYSEEPVLQITSPTHQPVPTTLAPELVSLLSKAHLPVTKIEHPNHGLELHFSSTDQQLFAFDLIKEKLGEHYTVALNLAPATPAWMRHLGANPMKQGLDLQGGIHFLLEVDINNVTVHRLDALAKEFGQTLRAAHLRYTGIQRTAHLSLALQCRDVAEKNIILSHLQAQYPDLLLTSAADQSTLYARFSETELHQMQQSTMEHTMDILRNRVNELGIGEAVVQQQGATRIAVDLPGIQDAARAKQILGGTATLEFHLVDGEHDPQSEAIPFQSKRYFLRGQPLLLKRQVVLSGGSITSATSSFDSQSASPAVHIQLGGGGEQLFSRVTRDSVGQRMAIVYVETKQNHRMERVISAPVIQTALGNSFQITGLQSNEEANDLALLLRAGALPTSLTPIAELTIGPSLGKENIHRGIVSLEVGMSIILVIMILYYHFFGLVANIALFLNLIFLSALMSLLGATLTLPGIAGFVLTVGMAVDANVLINERIREEIRRGLSPLAAIQIGYDRAFATIIDSNLTTLIVGIILFAMGSGPVKGFAIILCLGLLTSMLTSITYTRAIVDGFYHSRRHLKKISIGL